MSTWVEIAEGGRTSGVVFPRYRKSGMALTDGRGATTDHALNMACPRSGIGRGGHTFAQRLSRARLLYARRREAIDNWLALSLAMFIVLAAPSVPV